MWCWDEYVFEEFVSSILYSWFNISGNNSSDGDDAEILRHPRPPTVFTLRRALSCLEQLPAVHEGVSQDSDHFSLNANAPTSTTISSCSWHLRIVIGTF